MLILAKTLYWASLLVILYTYLGYGLLMAILAKLRSHQQPSLPDGGTLPMVTVLIPAYNEAPVLGAIPLPHRDLVAQRQIAAALAVSSARVRW